MPLPDFIVGGAPKCGTTSLFQYLSQHPKIFTSDPKEPNFFVSEGGEKRVRGMKFTRREYEELFDEKRPEQVAGEASTEYLFRADVSAPKIKKVVPDVKLIFVLRNPVERCYSDYWYRFHTGHIPLSKTFSSVVSDPSHMIFNGGKYKHGISMFFSHFCQDQILVLLTEDLSENSAKTLRRVCRHVGVEADFRFDLSVRHNETKYPRSVRLCRWIGHIAPGLSQWAAKTRWIRGLRSRLLFSADAEKPPMSESVRRKLADRYEQDIEELEHLIGRDLSHWR
jgi:hypothetical protein